MNYLKKIPNIIHQSLHSLVKPPTINLFNNFDMIPFIFNRNITVDRLHKRGPLRKIRQGNPIMQGRPFLKGVVLKTLIKKPRKPNSANRKCVLVRLSTGKEAIAFVPGIGHNLQEHQFVLIRGGRVKDLPGVKVRCVRGAYDLPHPGK